MCMYCYDAFLWLDFLKKAIKMDIQRNGGRGHFFLDSWEECDRSLHYTLLMVVSRICLFFSRIHRAYIYIFIEYIWKSFVLFQNWIVHIFDSVEYNFKFLITENYSFWHTLHTSIVYTQIQISSIAKWHLCEQSSLTYLWFLPEESRKVFQISCEDVMGKIILEVTLSFVTSHFVITVGLCNTWRTL